MIKTDNFKITHGNSITERKNQRDYYRQYIVDFYQGLTGISYKFQWIPCSKSEYLEALNSEESCNLIITDR